LILAGALLSACSPGHDSPPAPSDRAENFTLPPEQRAKIQLTTVVPVVFRRSIETTGTVTFDGDQATDVLAPISGPVSRLLVSLGDRVRKGQALATVASPDFAAAVSAFRKSEAAARNARRIADMDEKLFANDALSRRELDQAQTDADSAEADCDAAILQLRSLGVDEKSLSAIRRGEAVSSSESAIRAPISGTVVERRITPGQLLQAGATPCFTVADLSKVWVMASVFESDLPFVDKGAEADVLAASSSPPVRGNVDSVAALVDPATRAVAVRIVAPNPHDDLKKDMYVRVRIHSTRESRGLLAPASAILRDEENLPFVYLARSDGSFARTSVKLGSRVGDRYEITGGLSSGDRVVAEGALFMQFAQNQ
jgi:cobalt-zinc-cadmium efflux system membrane fusion protein